MGIMVRHREHTTTRVVIPRTIDLIVRPEEKAVFPILNPPDRKCPTPPLTPDRQKWGTAAKLRRSKPRSAVPV